MFGAGASIALLLAISRGGGPIGFILGGMVLSTLAGALTAADVELAAAAPGSAAYHRRLAELLGAREPLMWKLVPVLLRVLVARRATGAGAAAGSWEGAGARDLVST